ncbi:MULTISPECIES: Crp/Fnr family transcriptional regulator [Cryobacterium]|uniref:Crp/Fnr family transcriptional regulator n=1 Tax=Cryobacterium breve TaxID=1259258 RepID=A0ABY2IYP1_9MICO|nr:MULTISPECIES: Crp/Fnr family transcriptional regulator [Cryobacterium]TFC93903.1 Crp/Fnr family transcriptional regulator [Cryobacterium sp. TmT3-12]TFC97641.1 Crp/Fnr family transcriptional regulator [Cryobacterium breve]
MRLTILRQIPIFQDLPPGALADLAERMPALSWGPGDTLFSAGEPSEHVYVLAAGQAKAFRSTSTGQFTSLDFLGPGDLLGSLTAQDEGRYPETAVALVTTCALRLESVVFREVLLSHPPVALRVLDVVVDRLHQARSLEAEQASATVTRRVAATLLRLADTFGVPGERAGTTLIQLPLTRADLAAMTGTSAESASRAMSVLRRHGLIDSGRRWTAVLDRPGLVAAK